ncbi:hypothetical protein C8R43DRAFT_694937 [Mycena crocata]|nr:hypothetical protein C8R43DRAFT_694937 [Mycena crocata]
MPRDLPGLYFDVERNRYFPLASRPASQSHASSNLHPAVPSHTARTNEQHVKIASTSDLTASRRRPLLWSSGSTSAACVRTAQSLLHERLAGTQHGHSERVRWPVGGGAGATVCAMRTTTTPDGLARQFLGDARGWLYSRSSPSSSSSDWEHPEGGQHSAHEDADEERWTPWTAELCLHPESEISALCITGTRCVAVCFGPATKICVQDGDVPGRTYLLSLSAVRDVRAASLQGSALVLGAARKAVLLSDIDAAPPVRTLDTGSDVFAVAQRETLVYAGTRAGGVLRFDTRVNTNNKMHPETLCEATTSWNTGSTRNGAARSSVVFLQPIREGRELVVAYMDGRLGTFDLRFVRAGATPVVSYAGHVNSVSHRLGIALDPDERFVFAAGEDHRLRGWDLGNGAPLVPPNATTRPSAHHPPRMSLYDSTRNDKLTYPPRNPFATRFKAPLTALQIVDAGPGMALWAGGADEVWRWRLGV